MFIRIHVHCLLVENHKYLHINFNDGMADFSVEKSISIVSSAYCLSEEAIAKLSEYGATTCTSAMAPTVVSSAFVTKLVSTPTAHMVTASRPLDIGLTLAAPLEFLLPGEVVQLVVFEEVAVAYFILLTCLTRMSVGFALDTVIFAAVGARKRCVEVVKLENVLAVGGGTPIEIGAAVDSQGESSLIVLLQVIESQQHLQIGLSCFLLALGIRTLEREIALIDLDLVLLFQAATVEYMLSALLQYKYLSFLLFFIFKSQVQCSSITRILLLHDLI